MRIRDQLILGLVVLGSSACASRNKPASAPVTVVSVTLRVTNNLGAPLALQVSRGASEEIWKGNVAANATVETQLGSMTLGAQLSFRATTAQGNIVSARVNVPVRQDIVIWTIP